jgi:Gluconate 2-dehydrogenase subunit 3
MSEPIRIDRRTTIKWILAAGALPAMRQGALAATGAPAPDPAVAASGYGTDPDLMRTYAAGDAWPLVMRAPERRAAAALCDLILPADAESPGASAVGVVDFIDEWVSAPYQAHREDRRTILDGLAWLDAESSHRFGAGFAELDASRQRAICDPICFLPKADAALGQAARFFARFRDLTVGGFYTTPEGMRDVRYVGNVALARFDGPPPAVLRKVGLDGVPE